MKLVALDPGYIQKQAILDAEKINGIDEVVFYDNPPSDLQELYERVEDADLVTSRLYVDYNEVFFKKAPKLKAIFNNSVGYDNVDLVAATKLEIKLYNCPGYNARSVAELAFSLIVSLLRKIPAAQDHVKAGGVEYRPFEGVELYGKVLGLIGAGNVGSKILEIAEGFGMKVVVYTKNPSQERAKKLGVRAFSKMDSVLKNSDILVLSVPLNTETKGLISKNELEKMKKNAILVNVARQTVVDEYALAEALIGGRVGGAALDMVLEDPFNVNKFPLLIQEMVNLPNVIVTPHIGGETKEANDRLGRLFLENVESFLKGSDENCVNC